MVINEGKGEDKPEERKEGERGKGAGVFRWRFKAILMEAWIQKVEGVDL